MIFINAIIIQPASLRVRYETIASNKIPDDLDNFTILFFSDLHFLRFVNQKRATKIIEKINSIQTDAVVFLGDLFDSEIITSIDQSAIDDCIELLSAIKAKYGKFAVLGETDMLKEDSNPIVNSILWTSNFEVLENNNISLHFGSNQAIDLIGIHPTPDLAKAFKNLNDEHFHLVIAHSPAILSSLTLQSVDLVVSGHTHGGQINLPLIGALYQPKDVDSFITGRYFHNGILLDVNNGVGTSRIDARFNAPAEIVVYRLVKEK